VTGPGFQSSQGSDNERSADGAGGRWSGEPTQDSPYGSPASPATGDQTQAYGAPQGPGNGLPGYPGQYGNPAQPGPYVGAAMYPGYPAPPPSTKKKVVAALLAFFLGGTGAHNFYIGNKGRAIAQLIFLIVTWVIVIVGYSLAIAGTGTEMVRTYSGETYYVDEDADMIIGGGLLAILGYLMMGALWIWTMVEFIMILTSSGRYGRDREGYMLV
jgi:TM2 domain-containing membrane protein YozV